MSLRVVFFGSPEFAVPSLRSLSRDPRFEIAFVVSQPDRQAGRGRRVISPPVVTAARALELPVWQPDSLRSEEAVQRLQSMGAGLFVVVAYGEILRRSILSIPLHGCLNVHPSLLPKYRGSSPIPAAILNGDQSTGVSIIQMVRQLDAGPIVAQREVGLSGSETGGELSDRLAEIAAEMLPDVADRWCSGIARAVEQDESTVSYTRELTKADGRIDWTRPAAEIERLIRAYNPWPGAWTSLAGRRLVVHLAEVCPTIAGAGVGEISTDLRRVQVACGDSSLCLVQVQPEGKISMPASAWYRGLRSDQAPRFDPVPAGL